MCIWRVPTERDARYRRQSKMSYSVFWEAPENSNLSYQFFIFSEDDKPTILGEAEVKMAEVKRAYWFLVAKELKGEDHFRFLRAYTAGAYFISKSSKNCFPGFGDYLTIPFPYHKCNSQKPWKWRNILVNLDDTQLFLCVCCRSAGVHRGAVLLPLPLLRPTDPVEGGELELLLMRWMRDHR